MTYENINFQKPHMAYNKYFYMFDNDSNILMQKLSDGDTAFSYPLDTNLPTSVLSLEYDDKFFWTLENYDDDIFIKQWYIDNYICKLYDEFHLLTVPVSESFTVEHYNSFLVSDATSGTNFIDINDNFESTVGSGVVVFIGIDSEFEKNEVTVISGSRVYLKDNLIRDYLINEKVIFEKNFLIFSEDNLYIIPISNISGSNYLYYAGDHSNKQGNWEYTIASNIYFEPGLYKIEFEAYDNDQKDEMCVRIKNASEELDIKANSTGNNVWKQQSGRFCISIGGGYYDIIGRQLKSSNNIWGIDKVSVYRDILYQPKKVGYWPGDHSNKQGSWEYTIASNINLDSGTYFVKFDAYDADTSDEMSLRFESVSGTIDIIATRTGGDQWVEQDRIFELTISGSYDIKGRQLKSSSYIWGIDKVSLYKLDQIDYTKINDSEYLDVSACSFGEIKGVKTSPTYYLVYIKGSNLKFLNLDTMNLDGVAIIDNLKNNNSIIKVYDLSIDDTNVFRLQKEANYYGSDYSWSTYNYVLSTTRRFIDTINVSAYPVILPANAVNTAKITAIVNDQYGDGVVNKPVYFVDDDDVGFITIPVAYTDYFFGTGEAVTYYKAGVVPRTVTIEGTATQYD